MINMNIEFSVTPTFNSRTAEIRKADDIARQVTKAVPMISASKVEGMSFSSECFFRIC